MENVPRENIDRPEQAEQEEEVAAPKVAETEASLLEKPVHLNGKVKVPQQAKEKEEKQHQQQRQMDGGLRAWLIVLSSFLCNGLIFGVINSFSLVYSELLKILEREGVEEANGKAGE